MNNLLRFLRLTLPCLVLTLLLLPQQSSAQDDDMDGFVVPFDCDDTNPSIGLGDTWFADADGDSYGDNAISQVACTQPVGYVPDNTDCNDSDNAINPGVVWYEDFDSDLFGNTFSTLNGCTQPVGYVSVSGDCDDSDFAISPSSTEICGDLVDNNCNGQTDESGGLWFLDADGDGFGHFFNSSDACTQPFGYVSDNTDCDDSKANINPTTIWYRDFDNDLFGNTFSTLNGCTQPVGYVSVSGDCDDSDELVSPGALEACGDGIDNNCDGQTDESGGLWFLDADSDGFGDFFNSSDACTQPLGYVANLDDCDDIDPALPRLWYQDNDGDGYGTAAMISILDCAQPLNHVGNNADCNDYNIAVTPLTVFWYPDADMDSYGDNTASPAGPSCSPPPGPASWVNNNTDCNDSDTTINPVTNWTVDADADGFGDNMGTPTQGCTAPGAGYAVNNTDCNDTHAGINPLTNWYLDTDVDGFGDLTMAYVLNPTCGPVAGYAPNGGDCDDANATITVPSAIPTTGSAATYFADRYYTAADGWSYYYSCGANKLLLALKQKAWRPGTLVSTPPATGQFAIRVDVGAAATVDLGSSPGYSVFTPEWVVMNRTWDVQLFNLAQEPTTLVGVRAYYTQGDFDAINTALGVGFEVPNHGLLNHYKLKNATPPTGSLYTNSMDALTSLHAGITGNNIVSYHPDAFANDFVHVALDAPRHYAEYMVDGFSGGGGGGGLGGAGAFPVELVAFSATPLASGAYLSWTTASEQNMASFTIERSLNSSEFLEIGSVKAAGNSNDTRSYSFTDREHKGTYYYRLRMAETDGKATYSQIVEVNLQGVNGIALTAQPNPFRESVSLHIVSIAAGVGTITLTDLTGQTLETMYEPLSEGLNIIPLSLEKMAQGVYFVNVWQGGRMVQQKIVKL